MLPQHSIGDRNCWPRSYGVVAYCPQISFAVTSTFHTSTASFMWTWSWIEFSIVYAWLSSDTLSDVSVLYDESERHRIECSGTTRTTWLLQATRSALGGLRRRRLMTKTGDAAAAAAAACWWSRFARGAFIAVCNSRWKTRTKLRLRWKWTGYWVSFYARL